MLILGANIGVLLNRLLPSIVTLIGLVLVMLRSAIKMKKKIGIQRKKEKDAAEKKKAMAVSATEVAKDSKTDDT